MGADFDGAADRPADWAQKVVVMSPLGRGLAALAILLPVLYLIAPRRAAVDTAVKIPPTNLSAPASTLTSPILATSASVPSASATTASASTPVPRRTGTVEVLDFSKEVREEEAGRYVYAKLAVSILRNSMRDPDSFVPETVYINDKPGYACIQYRARNGFGGMNRDVAVVSLAGASTSAAKWNKQCAGKSLHFVDASGL